MSATKPSKASTNAVQPDGLPPHSVEAEQAVLGGLMIANQAWDDVCELISSEDAFYVPENRVLWKAIKSLASQGLPFDVVTIAEQLSPEERVFLDLGYLGRLAKETPSVANIAVYANIVRDRYRLRRLSLLGSELRVDALSGVTGGEELVQRTEKQLSELLTPKNSYTPLSETLAKAIEHIDHAFNSTDGITGISTGYADLDKVTAGLQPSDLIVVAGRPSMGKTTFGMNLIENALQSSADSRAFVFSLEMPSQQLILRLLASIGRLNLQKLRTGQLDDDDWPRLTMAAERVNRLDGRLIIDDENGLSATAIKARARRYARKFGKPSLIMVDYLQLIQEPGAAGTGNRNLEITYISLTLKQLARELSCPVVALSQLNRSLEQRPNKRPILSDLRESGAIEQDADVIMFVYRDEVYHPETENKGIAEVIIGKQRNGPLDTVLLAFNGSSTRFDSLEYKFGI